LGAALEQPEGEPKRRSRSTDAEPDTPEGKMSFGLYYETAAAIGLSTSELRTMSLWQFVTYVEGYRKANDPKAANELTGEEEDALAEMIGVA